MAQDMQHFVVNIATDLKNSDLPRVFLSYLISKTYFPQSPKLAHLDLKAFYLNLINKTLHVLKRHENVDFHSDLTTFVPNLMSILNFYPLIEDFLKESSEK